MKPKTPGVTLRECCDIARKGGGFVTAAQDVYLIYRCTPLRNVKIGEASNLDQLLRKVKKCFN